MYIIVSKSSLIIKMFFLLFSTISTLVFSEVVVRLVVPKKFWATQDYSRIWIRDDLLGWANVPDLNDAFISPEGKTVEINTNSDGFFEYGTKTSKNKVFMLGDSTTFGFAVPNEERIHCQLHGMLKNQGFDSFVVNASCQAYSTDQEYLVALNSLEKNSPCVVTIGVCSNDFDYLGSPIGYENYKPFLNTDGSVVYPKNKEIKKNYFSFYSRIFQLSALYNFVSPVLRRLKYRNDTVNIMGLGGEMKIDKDKIVNFKLIVFMLSELCKKHNSNLLIYCHPPYEDIDEEKSPIEGIVQSVCLDIGVPFVSVHNYLRIKKIAKEEIYLLPRDPHCNGLGYKLQAEVLAKAICDLFLVNHQTITK